MASKLDEYLKNASAEKKAELAGMQQQAKKEGITAENTSSPTSASLTPGTGAKQPYEGRARGRMLEKDKKGMDAVRQQKQIPQSNTPKPTTPQTSPPAVDKKTQLTNQLNKTNNNLATVNKAKDSLAKYSSKSQTDQTGKSTTKTPNSKDLDKGR